MSTILITGAGGYVGQLLVAAFAADAQPDERIIATDLRLPTKPVEGVDYRVMDVTQTGHEVLFAAEDVDVVVHLAAIVTPKPGDGEALAYRVDVDGTRHVLDACLAANVGKIVLTSSGAAYGYHADSAELLTEDCPLRGNDAFAYSRHKRIVEEMLAEYRAEHPALAQLIFRPGTILGETVHNQITDLFEKGVMLGLSDSATPFNFIWDADVVAVLMAGARGDGVGIFNLAGDGVMTLREIAHALGKPYLSVPSGIVAKGIELAARFGRTQYGPEQVRFLKYRPVMSNHALKTDFGFTPRKTSREVFALYAAARHG
jgi:UDP-glucose 4-epimerase